MKRFKITLDDKQKENLITLFLLLILVPGLGLMSFLSEVQKNEQCLERMNKVMPHE